MEVVLPQPGPDVDTGIEGSSAIHDCLRVEEVDTGYMEWTYKS